MTVDQTSALKVTLPSDLEIVMTRVFNAPRELVFRAHVDPDLVSRWWGMRGSTTIVEKTDVRPGGAWRFVQRVPGGTEYGPEGTEYGFRGEYREVVPPERLTWTFEFEGMPGHILVETFTFTETDGKTTLTSVSVFETKEERDGMLASGMEGGAAESLDRLEELLATL